LAYGEAGDKVEADLKGAVPVMRGGTFDDVLRRARDAAREGDAVLLSPACSSYDMFDNYEQRGDTFRAWVQAL
jgi:UDP-N-acetylmuramoylalanine--D-glutamate ligase